MPLSVKDGMGAWIKDFQDSNAPQFKGKSDKERREMAMAAYLSAKRGDKKEATDNPPFTPDPPKPKQKNSDGTTSSPMSRAKQLAKMARDRGMKKEDVELDEAKDNFASAAKELKTYADKRGGMDKKDFHTAAKHIENIGRANLMSKGQHLAQLSKHLRDLDTSPREKVLSVLNKHGHNVGDFMSGAKMRRESIEESTLLDIDHTDPDFKGLLKKHNVKHKVIRTHDTGYSDIKLHGHPDAIKKVKKTMNYEESVQEAGSPERYKMIKKAGDKYNKEKKKAERDAMKAMSKDKDMMGENVSDIEQTARTHLDSDKVSVKKTTGGHAINMSSYHDHNALVKHINKLHNKNYKVKAVQDTFSGKRVTISEETKVKLKGFGPDHAKGNMGNPAARATLGKRMADNEKARQALKDPSHNPAWANSKSKTEKTVSELKKSTLGSYVNKAARDAASKAYGAASAAKDNRADQSGKDFSKSLKRLRGIDTATKKLTKEDIDEAKSFDQKFKDHLKFATSKSPAVQAYMKKRAADRDAMNKKNDPNAAKKGYALSATPPERAYKKARKKGMSASDASQAVGTASRNRSRKLPK